MSAVDLDRVMEIVASLHQAPRWPVSAYVAAMDPGSVPRRIVLVAADSASDAPVGFLLAGLVPPDAELETIAVALEWQRRGVGELLLQALIQELRKVCVIELHLEVRASNLGALSFYSMSGFAETGRRVRYYADPEEDAVLMRLSLAE
jgi:[ribosomal protein S18]-alanine N-acetyltransferase